MKVGPQLEALTLESIADGSAEALFQEELARVGEFFDEPGLWASGADGKIKASITLVIDLIYDDETHTTQTEVNSKLKRPARKGVRRPVFRGNDGWSSVREARQMRLGDAESEGDDDGGR